MKTTPPAPLIIAGMGEQQFYAAAVLLCRWPDAELEIASAKYLAQVLKNAGVGHRGRPVFIAGVPIQTTPEMVTAAGRLERNHSQITWMGLAGQWKAPAAAWQKHLVSATATFADVALEIAAPARVTARMRLICDVARDFQSVPDGENLSTLARAALWAATELGDFEACRQGIRCLADNSRKADAPRLEPIVAQYREWGAARQSDKRNEGMKSIYRQAWALGKQGKCRVLITGETGTGKETIARVIHASSPRVENPFVAFNCADISPQLLEGKLFGYLKGSFTGAIKDYKGAFERANGGTLFLDEVAELPLPAQAGLLRVLQEGRFTPLGSEEEVAVDVRILAATNRNLKEMMQAGKFREDLYYRLNAVALHLPPLRERPEDIESIVLFHHNQRPTPEQLEALCRYSWPGNVRELLSTLDRARILHDGDLSKVIPHDEPSSGGMADESLAAAARAHVKKIHARYGESNARAAKALNISVNTLKKHLLPNGGKT